MRYLITFLLTFLLLTGICLSNPVYAKKKNKPQPLVENNFTLIKYNNPSGTRDLNLKDLNIKRQITGQGVVSPDFSKMVYSEVYLYPQNKQTSSRLFVINLDNTTESPIQKILNASVLTKNQKPLLETGMNSLDTYIFRTLTPVDWSPDSNKLIIKEIIGYHQNTIWGTNLWVYDFSTGKAKNLAEIRDAVKYYWKNNHNLYLEDFRWDTAPIGWDLKNPNRIIVNSYGYNYGIKQFLGCWAIDYHGNRSELLSLSEENWPVSQNGLILKEITKKQFYIKR